MTLRELLRTPEGTITRPEFRRGAAFTIFVTGACALVLALVARLSRSMDWMTVAVAPVMGGVILVVSLSLIYFWYCLFAKRLRGLGTPLHLLHAMLAAILIGSTGRLVEYQNQTLGMELDGLLAHAGSVGTLFSFLAVLFFFILLGMGWLGPDRVVAPSCPLEPGPSDDAER